MEDFVLFLTWHSGNDTSPREAAFILLRWCPCAKPFRKLLSKLKSLWGIFKNITARKSSSNKDEFDFFFFFNGSHSETNLVKEAKSFQFW